MGGCSSIKPVKLDDCLYKDAIQPPDNGNTVNVDIKEIPVAGKISEIVIDNSNQLFITRDSEESPPSAQEEALYVESFSV